MKPQHHSATLIPVSTIGVCATVVMSGELLRDVTRGTHHFMGPRWLKIVALCGMLAFVAMESEKVLRHIDNALLRDDGYETSPANLR